MKCPECKKKMSRLETTCTACGHVLTEKDVRKAKVKRRLAIWIPLGSFLFLCALLLLIILIPEADVEEITINNPNGEVEYLEPLSLTICCSNNGAIRTTYEVPIIIDDETVKVAEFIIPGYENVTQDITIERDALPDVGRHTLKVLYDETDIEILGPAKFDVFFPSDDLALAVGENYEIDFEVENNGQSEGTFEYAVTFDGQEIETGDMTIAAANVGYGTTSVSSDTAGSFDLSINGTALSVPFYESKPYENGHYLMKNTVKGYSYIEIKNNSTKDMVAYVTKADDLTTAVIARYIVSGDVHKVNSIVSGDYMLFIQTGELWLPEVTKFGKNEKFYEYGPFDFENSVYNGSGTLQYMQFDILDCELDRYLRSSENCPTIPEK